MTAWRLSAACPSCGAALRLRRRRADGGEFLGCSRYPRCDHAEEFDPYLDALAEQVDDLRARLALASARLAAREREATPEGVDLPRELRGLIALAHPDRWPHAADLAHEVTARLTDLRRRVAA